MVQGGRDDERDQDKPGDSDAPGYVDTFGVQGEDLRRISVVAELTGYPVGWPGASAACRVARPRPTLSLIHI